MSSETAEDTTAGSATHPVHAENDPILVAGGGIAIQCQFCVGRSFRRSRLRSSDLPQLFLMRYPVRCRRCSQRQMVSFTVAGVSVPSHVPHKQRRGSRERDVQADAE